MNGGKLSSATKKDTCDNPSLPTLHNQVLANLDGVSGNYTSFWSLDKMSKKSYLWYIYEKGGCTRLSGLFWATVE